MNESIRATRVHEKSAKMTDNEVRPGVYDDGWMPEEDLGLAAHAAQPLPLSLPQSQGQAVVESGAQGNSSHEGGKGLCGGAAVGATGEATARGRRALTTAQREDRVAERVVVNEYMAELVKVRKILQKVRLEHALLEAYQADGWCSASREKVKPVAEIARARAKLVQYKAEIKESIKAMDESGGDRRIDQGHYDSDGELGEEHIFCGKCGEYESSDDNDIILCDGNCHRAYHQLCVRPPIDLDAIEEGEPWLCPACDAKDDATEFINDEFGTDYTLETPWDELFTEQQQKEEHGVAGAPAGGGSATYLLLGEDLPSDDEDDVDFNASAEECVELDDDDSSASEAESAREAGSDGGSEESGLDGSDGSTDDGDTGGEQDAAEELRSLQDGTDICWQGMEAHGKASSLSLSVPRKRRRKAVDYKALNQAMFGDHESYEGEGGDDEWSPTAATPTKAARF